jgi:hypothetical protein
VNVMFMPVCFRKGQNDKIICYKTVQLERQVATQRCETRGLEVMRFIARRKAE